MSNPSPTHLRSRMERIWRNLRAAEQKTAALIAPVHLKQRRSAVNLIHYLALRLENLRPLQDQLHDAGLSSLASAEGHILWQVQAVLKRLGASFSHEEQALTNAGAGTRLLRQRAAALFGSKADAALPHIMVTFDTDMADDYAAVEALLKAGMQIARINCAHDDPEVWERMAKHVRKAAKATGLPCKVYLDLAGPKVRTVLLGKGRYKRRVKLKENETVWMAEEGATFNKKEKVIGCTLAGVVNDLRTGDRVLFDDGLFEAVVETPGNQMAALRITRISAVKPRLKAEKGINFPIPPCRCGV